MKNLVGKFFFHKSMWEYSNYPSNWEMNWSLFEIHRLVILMTLVKLVIPCNKMFIFFYKWFLIAVFITE